MTLTVSRPKINEKSRITPTALAIPEHRLLGPGPSNANPDVVAAMNRQPIGHLDPAYLNLMDEVQSMMRYVWQTENPMTLPISGTGSAAMEATRSEERRVGKECRSRWSPYH